MVASSIGHIRDLPNRATDVPEESGTSRGRWRVASTRTSSRSTSSTTTRRRSSRSSSKLLKGADELLLATDEDREGEAIAWHLLQVLKPKVPVRRMVFHEITTRRDRALARRDAPDRRAARRRPGDETDPRPPLRLRGLAGALEEGHAAASRRGACSPSRRGSSSSASASGCAFVEAAYWDLEGIFDPGSFDARLVALDGKRVARGRDFGPDGELRATELVAPRRGVGARARRALDGARVHGPQHRREALHAPAHRRRS